MNVYIHIVHKIKYKLLVWAKNIAQKSELYKTTSKYQSQENKQTISSDSDYSNGYAGVDSTGILFGNIDSSDRLESDFLDNETKIHLSSLAR